MLLRKVDRFPSSLEILVEAENHIIHGQCNDPAWKDGL